MQVTTGTKRTPQYWIMLALTLMASGRAMTLLFIGRAGGGGAGDPPDAWLMPLIGDAVVGISALAIAWLLWKRPSPTVWVVAIAWNAIAAFDALAAYLVDVVTPWPEFFMLELFGRSMFFAAAAMHVVLIILLAQRPLRDRFSINL